MPDLAQQVMADHNAGLAAQAQSDLDALLLEHPTPEQRGRGIDITTATGETYPGNAQQGTKTVPGAVTAVAKDIGKGVVETPAAVVTGAVNGVNEALSLVDQLGDTMQRIAPLPGVQILNAKGEFAPGIMPAAETTALMDNQQAIQVPNPTPPPDSTTGKLIEGISQFLTGFAAGGKALKAAKLGGVATGAVGAMAKGAISDFAFFDGQTSDLSSLIQGTPLANPVTEFLQTDQETPELVGRLKHAMEGVGLGVLTDATLTALRALRSAGRARAANTNAAEAEAALADAQARSYRQAAGDPKGPDFHQPPPPGEKAKLDKAGRELKAAHELLGVGITDASEPRIGLNMARVNTPEDVARLIRNTEDLNQGAIRAARRFKRDWKTVAADSEGMDAYRLLMERESGETLNDAQVLAARKLDLTAFASVREAAETYRATPTPATSAALREAWTKAYAIHKEVLGARAEAARALAVWRMQAGAGDNRAMASLMDAAFSNGGKESSDEIAKRVLTIDPIAHPEDAVRFMEKSWSARTADMVKETYQGFLLSSPKTQAVNIIGNSVTLAHAIAERAATGRMAELLGDESGVAVGEAAAMSFGARQGFADSLRYAAKVAMANVEIAARKTIGGPEGALKAAERKAAMRGDLLAAQGRKDENYTASITAENMPQFLRWAGFEFRNDNLPGMAINALGALVRTPGNAMAFADDMFKLMNHRAELWAQAFRQASKEVRAGDIPEDGLAGRVADLVETPTEEIATAARNAAEERTFTTPPGQTARLALQLRRSLDSIPGVPLPVGSALIPFVNTPANLMGYAMRRTPLAPLFAKYRAAMEAGGAEEQLAKTQMALGTMSMLLMADYAQAGLVTGGAPIDRQQADLWRREGIQPYSIRGPNGTWIAYNRLDPVGTVLSIGADLAQLFGETPLESDDEHQLEFDEAFAASAGAVGNMLLNKTYLTGLSGATEYINDPTRYGENYLGSLVSGALVPNVIRDVAHIQDPYVREASNMLDKIKARIPGLSQDLPIRMDLWGRPMKRTGAFGPVYDAFSPIQVRKEDQAPVDKELMRLRADVAMPSKSMTVDGVTVSLRNRPDIYNDYVHTAGSVVTLPHYYDMTMFDYLNALVSGKLDDSELYRERLDTRGVTQRDDDEKIDMIKGVMREYRSAAMEVVKQRYAHDLQRMADQKRQELQSAQ